LLFAEASHGNLQAYIDRYNDTIGLPLRVKWCSQATEAIRYIHQKGVIHSDLRPENYLLHTDSTDALNLLLCDFGGSTSGDIDGRHLPDSGFFNPNNPWISTEATDIFSLGSVFYTIMTGHWPYKSPGPFTSMEEMEAYGEMVDTLFVLGEYPHVDDIVDGAIIKGCWTGQYREAGMLVDEQTLCFNKFYVQSEFDANKIQSQ
jgi:serine/threonine protein kinase